MPLQDGIWGYGDGNENDEGYGCVYRNVQTLLQMLTGKQPLSVTDLRTILQVPWSENKKSMWIVPRDAEKLINKLVPCATTSTFTILKVLNAPWSENKKSMWIVPRDATTSTFTTSESTTREIVQNFIQQSLHQAGSLPILVDNGTSSYLILEKRGDFGYLIGDPHKKKPSQRRRLLTKQNFFRNFFRYPKWMILVVMPSCDRECTRHGINE